MAQALLDLVRTGVDDPGTDLAAVAAGRIAVTRSTSTSPTASLDALLDSIWMGCLPRWRSITKRDERGQANLAPAERAR